MRLADALENSGCYRAVAVFLTLPEALVIDSGTIDGLTWRVNWESGKKNKITIGFVNDSSVMYTHDYNTWIWYV